MDKKLVVKRLQSGILLVMGVIVVLALLFPLLKVTYIYYDYSDYPHYYYYYSKTLSENGFNMFAFDSDFISPKLSLANIPLGIVSIFTLIVATTTIVIAVVGLINGKIKISKNVTLTFIIICLVQLFLYMLSGIIFQIVSKGIGVWYRSAVIDAKSIKTQAFIPFIFGVLIAVSFFMLPIIVKENGQSGKTNTVKTVSLSGINVQNKLSELKQLWDLGVITEEEYKEKCRRYIDYL